MSTPTTTATSADSPFPRPNFAARLTPDECANLQRQFRAGPWGVGDTLTSINYALRFLTYGAPHVTERTDPSAAAVFEIEAKLMRDAVHQLLDLVGHVQEAERRLTRYATWLRTQGGSHD